MSDRETHQERDSGPTGESTPEHDPLAIEWEDFDNEFREHRTPFETIVRGHLYVQSALINYVEAGLVSPEALDLARVDFSLLVKLAVAVGILDLEDEPGFQKLNTLRNRFAHNLDADLTLQDAIDFYHSLSPRYRLGAQMEDQKPFQAHDRYRLIVRSIKSLYFGVKLERRGLLEYAHEHGLL